jgi:hypothetical protein
MSEDRKEEEKAEVPVECTATIKHSHDTDAAWIKKGKKPWYGYKSELVST